MEISTDRVSIGKHTTTTCSIALQRTALHWNTEHTLTLTTFRFIPLRDPTQFPIHWLLGALFRGKNNQYVKLTTYLHPVSKFMVSGGILLAPHASSWFGGYTEGQLRLHHIHTSSKFL